MNWISPSQCRAARDMLAISLHELASVTGIDERTIASFEDGDIRTIALNNVSVIGMALERLGIVVTSDTIKWRPPFTEAQTRVIKALAERSTRHMKSATNLITETGCWRADLEALATLRIITGIDGYPMLTTTGLHMPGLLDDHEHNETLLKIKYAPVNYNVADDGKVVIHRETSAVFHINEDGTAAMRFSHDVPHDEAELAKLGAAEAAQMDRDNHPDFAIRKIGAEYRHV